MCGIAGILGLPEELAQRIAPRMSEAMRHRGPDDQGIQFVPDPTLRHPPAVLLHRRLAILDLTAAGHQPMHDHPRDPNGPPHWITFNGEIFNFLELRDELARNGWPCRTRCDTEVILHSYRIWGPDCVHRLNGMFAWCLLDATRGVAWFCRDRLGVKPLYLFWPRSGGLLFASEVRTLLAAGAELVPPAVSRQALESFFAQGAVHGQQTIIANVRRLDPGESLVTEWSGKPITRKAYWTFPKADEIDDSPRERVVEQTRQCLREATRLQLISDVPLGLFLSGGIDSSGLAAMATDVAGTQVRTICIGFDQAEFDESAAAAAVARQLGTEHRTVRLTGDDVLRDLPQVLAAVDQPTVDGFNTYFVAQAARRVGLTVALSGVGGDELFGGYASFRDVPRALAWGQRLRWLGPARHLLEPLLCVARARGTIKAAQILHRGPSLLQMYLLRRELFLGAERRALHALPEGSDAHSGMPHRLLDELASAIAGLDVVNQVSRLELLSYLRHMLLRDADVFSMVHALEMRVPLLDYRLVEQVLRLPGMWKRPDPRPKPLLVDAIGTRLPSAAYREPKRGFTFPWDAWLRGPVQPRARSAMHNRDVWRTLCMNPSAPQQLWERFLRGDRRVAALQVLALLVLEDFTTRHGLRSDR